MNYTYSNIIHMKIINLIYVLFSSNDFKFTNLDKMSNNTKIEYRNLIQDQFIMLNSL